ncbi:MAG: M28 family peptidase [Saprospiraceae bacterium]|nr:M28 family peptidase [Saprospiraceae bacterium]
MKTVITFLALLHFTFLINAQNAVPKIKNFEATFLNIKETQFGLEVSDAENDTLNIGLKFSIDNGLNYQKVYDFSDYVIGKSALPNWKIPDTLVSQVNNLIFKVTVSDNKKIDIQQIVNQVDTNRLRKELTYIQGIRHRTAGKVHLAEVQDSLSHQFVNLGLDTAIQRFTYSGYDAKNIMGATKSIGNEDSLYILCAHYDSVNNGPGADDNGSGVVGMNEIARIFAPYSFKKKIKFIGFDLEEAGLIGSTKFITNKGVNVGEKLMGAIDYEMIGFYSDQANTQLFPTGFNLLFPAAYAQSAADNFKGNFITNVANVASDSLKKRFDNAASTYVKDLKVISIAVPGNGSIAPDLRRSDHAPFWDAGYPALMLTDGANFRNLNYHTAKDSIQLLNFTFMGNVVKATIGMLAEAAGIEHTATATTKWVLEVNNDIILQENHIKLFPNPTQSILNIELADDRLVNGNLIINEVGGKLVMKTKVNSISQQINIAQLPNGIYQMTIEKDGIQAITKFIKQ